MFPVSFTFFIYNIYCIINNPTHNPIQHNHGRRRSSVDFYKPKKRVPLQSLRPRVGSGRAKHFGAAAFEAFRNIAAVN
jgi:hypothetical protein